MQGKQRLQASMKTVHGNSGDVADSSFVMHSTAISNEHKPFNIDVESASTSGSPDLDASGKAPPYPRKGTRTVPNEQYLVLRTPRYMKDGITSDNPKPGVGSNAGAEVRSSVTISGGNLKTNTVRETWSARNDWRERDIGNSSSTKVDERAEVVRNSMARHRTESLTKHVHKRSPWIGTAVEQLRRHRASQQTVRAIMEDIGARLEPGAVYVVLNELQRLHEWRTVLELFKWIKQQPWHRPSERFYNMMIGFLGREGQPELATLLFEDMLLEKVPPNNYTYTALINAYGRARMFDQAMAVFEYMKECEDENCRPNTVTCNTLIGTLCRSRKYDMAVQILLSMRESHNFQDGSCRPNVVTYNTLIDSLCREGQIKSAVDVLDDMASGKLDPGVAPGTVTYNIIVDACGKAGKAGKAEQLVKDMESRGLKPDNATFTALIDAYGKAGELEKAESTFQRMQQRGLRADVLTCTTLLSAYGRAGALDKAEQFFKEMGSFRVQPNEVTFLALMDAYAKAGRYELAEKVFSDMIRKGYKHNVYTYSALMDAYGKSGQYQAVVRTFQEMKREGCRTNLITYAAMLTACARSQNWENALLVLYCLQQSGGEWELSMCRLVLGGPEEDTVVWENASKMFEGMQKFPLSMRRSFYNALIDALWSYGLRQRAAKVAEVGRKHDVYGDDMFVFANHHAESSEWIVDLHDNSIGSAAAHLFAWLSELRTAWKWQHDVPQKICIVTGWGKHRRLNGEPPLKAQIMNELNRLQAPFEEDPDNSGRIHASGSVLRSWLLKPEVESQLALGDSGNPRPVGESPYQHL